MLEEHDLLVGALGIPGVDRRQPGNGLEELADLLLRRRDARVRLRPVIALERRGVATLEPAHGERVGVARQQAVEHRRSGAGQAANDGGDL